MCSLRKTVVFTRYSSDKQTEQAQMQGIKDYIQKNNIVVDLYVNEDAVSGYKTRLEDRHGLQELIQMALNDELDTIIVFNQDRLGRRLEILSFMTIMKEQNVRVLSVTEGDLISGQDTDELIQAIKFWTANYESKKTSHRVKSGKKNSASKLIWQTNTIPYGYKKRADKTLEIIEEEANIIQKAFEYYINYGSGKACDMLNKEGYTKRGVKWSRNTLKLILRNELYTGKFKYKGEVVATSEGLRIISDAQFNRVQKIKTCRKTTPNTSYDTRSEDKLVGLLYHTCSDGVERRLSINYTYSKGKSYVSYRCQHCRTMRYDVKKTYGGKWVKQAVEWFVLSWLDNLSSDVLQKQIEANKSVALRELNFNLLSKQKELKKSRTIESNATDELVKIFAGESVLDKNMVNNMVLNAKAKVETLTKEIVDIEDKILKEQSKNSNKEAMLEQLISYKDLYKIATTTEKKIILQNIISKIVIKPDGTVNIRLKYEL